MIVFYDLFSNRQTDKNYIYESSFNNFIVINVPLKSKIFVLIFIF